MSDEFSNDLEKLQGRINEHRVQLQKLLVRAEDLRAEVNRATENLRNLREAKETNPEKNSFPASR